MRVSEEERKLFDFLKILCDGAWNIKNGQEFLSIVEFLGLVNGITQQLYYFIYYAFEALSFQPELFDMLLKEKFNLDL